MGDAQVDALIARISNWGRWGPEDELGTLNFITPEVRVGAARSIRTGKCFSLAIPLDEHGPQPVSQRRPNPFRVMMETGTDVRAGVQPGAIDGYGGSDDIVTMALQAATQWDSLAHVFYDFKMYNNRDCTLVDAMGAWKNSITVACDRMVTRGVLLDIARYRGEPHLSLDYRITADEMERVLEWERIDLRSGDVLLLRTGNLGRALATGWDRFVDSDEPGVGLDALPWLHDRQISALAADTWAVEVIPSGTSIKLPVHATAIVHMGLLLGEIFNLDELAANCAQDGVYDFLLCAAPLPFTRAVGSPVNPLAVK
jgi:kynurenine formamidase